MRNEIKKLNATKVDARKLKPEAQFARRMQVIRLYKHCVSLRQIVAETGMSTTAVSRVIKLYESGGVEALAPQVRGRPPVVQRDPPIGNGEAIQLMICGGRQRQVGKPRY